MKNIFFYYAVILILVAGLRRPGIDWIYGTYVEIFNKFDTYLSYFKDYSIKLFFSAYYLIPKYRCLLVQIIHGSFSFLLSLV